MIKELVGIVNNSKNIVFFGGAGVSTESQIPDFRSNDGIYSQDFEHSPEYMLSNTFFMSDTEEFYRFYKTNMIFKDAKPNMAHNALSALEDDGCLSGIVTQNIDGLHQKAGSENVVELHGSVYRNYCTLCNHFFPLDYVLEVSGVPFCDCKGVVKPDVVLYEEMLDPQTTEKAITLIRNADVLIVGGTSLSVYPAAGLIEAFRGKHLVLINKTRTTADSKASVIIRRPIGEVLGEVVNECIS